MGQSAETQELPVLPRESWEGDATLMTWPSAAVLNSRQSRYPAGAEPWIAATVRAAAWASGDGRALIAGTGLASWELSVAAASDALGGVILLAGVPKNWPAGRVQRRLQELIREFNLTHQPALVIPYAEDTRAPKRLWPARDRWIAGNAGLLLPVSVRSGGSMAALLGEEPGRVDERFRVPHAPRRHRFPPLPDPETARTHLKEDWEGWAVHWTRTQAGPWPGETSLDYYRGLAGSGDRPPRTAQATLLHILREGVIRGSGRHMPAGRAMVGLSALHPAEALELMRWRKRYVEPAYEPWGVAVTTRALERLGGRSVRYGTAEERKSLQPGERLFFQTVSERADWEREREWRTAGDIRLRELAEDEVRVVVRSKGEAEPFRAFPWETRWFIEA